MMLLLILFILYLIGSVCSALGKRAIKDREIAERMERQREAEIRQIEKQREAERRAEYKRQIAEQKRIEAERKARQRQLEAEHKARQKQLEAEQRESDKLSLLQSKAIQGRIDIDCYEPIRSRLEAELDTVYEELEAMRITVNGSSASNCSEYIPPIAQARVDKLTKQIAGIDKKLEKAYYAVSRFESEKARPCNA